MKSNPSAQNREGIRLKILWPIAALIIVVLIAAILAKSHSGDHAKPAQDTVVVAPANITAAPSETSARPSRIPRVSQPQAMTEPETERLAALLLDKNTPLQVRRQSARSLAHIGTEQALATLKSGLTSDLPPYVKAAIAESLGQVSSPEATALLHELVSGKDETIARGAARGLASHGDADAANTLGTLLFNDQIPISVRTESALALGDVNLPAAQDYLTRAISQIHDDEVLESALDGMGRRPFSETEEFFRNYLNSPTVPTEAKVLAIEAVRDADGEITPFLSNYADDGNPDVRNAAKAALDFLKPIPSKPATGK